MKQNLVSFYLGFCLEESAQGVRAITHEELECGEKKVRDSKAKEMYCLNNFNWFFLVEVIQIFVFP